MIRHPAQEQLHRLTVKTLDYQLLGEAHAIWRNWALSQESVEQKKPALGEQGGAGLQSAIGWS